MNILNKFMNFLNRRQIAAVNYALESYKYWGKSVTHWSERAGYYNKIQNLTKSEKAQKFAESSRRQKDKAIKRINEILTEIRGRD